MSKADPALFYYHKDNNLIGMIAIHVENFLWSGTTDFERNFTSKLRNTFAIGKENQSIFKYLGLTRPDIVFDVCQLGTSFKNSGEQDIKYINKVLTYLKQDSVQIKYKQLGKDDNLKLIIYADASHGNLSDGGSQLGYLIFLVGENQKSCLVNWQSKCIKHVVISSLSAEILALSDAVDDGVYIAELNSELLFNRSKQISIGVYTNRKSLFDALNSKKNVTEKRLRIDIALLREMMDLKIITKLHCIDSQSQLANVLTKKGASTKELLDTIRKGVTPI